MVLPTVASDGHLHDLGGAFIDGGDTNVAFDLLHDILAGVAVTTVRLDGRVGRVVAGFGRHQLRDRSLGVHRTVLAEAPIDLVGRLLDVAAGRFEAHRVRNDQLVCEALLLGKRRTALLPLE